MLYFITKYRGHRKTCHEHWHAHYSVDACNMVTSASMSQGQFMRDLGTCILLASVVGFSIYKHVLSYTRM